MNVRLIPCYIVAAMTLASTVALGDIVFSSITYQLDAKANGATPDPPDLILDEQIDSANGSVMDLDLFSDSIVAEAGNGADGIAGASFSSRPDGIGSPTGHLLDVSSFGNGEISSGFVPFGGSGEGTAFFSAMYTVTGSTTLEFDSDAEFPSDLDFKMFVQDANGVFQSYDPLNINDPGFHYWLPESSEVFSAGTYRLEVEVTASGRRGDPGNSSVEFLFRDANISFAPIPEVRSFAIVLSVWVVGIGAYTYRRATRRAAS